MDMFSELHLCHLGFSSGLFLYCKPAWGQGLSKGAAWSWWASLSLLTSRGEATSNDQSLPQRVVRPMSGRSGCSCWLIECKLTLLSNCWAGLTMPASCWWPYPGRVLLALLKSQFQQRWWKQLIQLKTVWLLKDSLFCGWSPTERLTALLIDGSFLHVRDFCFTGLCHHSVVKVGCGGSGTWDFSNQEPWRWCCHWLLGKHQPPTDWFLRGKPMQEWIDSRCRRSLLFQGTLVNVKRQQSACSKEIPCCKHQTFQPQIFNLSYLCRRKTLDLSSGSR